MQSHLLRRVKALLLVCVLALATRQARAYSVQTHEQMIDLTWKASIVPLLQARFPNLTAAQLQEAHAFAYGGSAIQDVGYYPFGNAFFSDLTHYVRTGDFVDALLLDAKTPNELAFAVGALSHYIGDSTGHSLAVNPSVAAEFPKLAHKYGNSVSYEEGPHNHVRTEFAFDINEIAKHRFAPRRYLEHVGLYVATGLLGRAFFQVYGLPLDKTVGVQHRTIAGYSFGVRHFLPRIAYAENILHKRRFPADSPSPDLTTLKADLKQSDEDNGWETYRGKPGIGTYTLAGFIYITPRIGVLSDLAIRGPSDATEQLYVHSVVATTVKLRAALLNLRTPPPATGPRPVRQVDFPNLDLDTGVRVRPGGYRLTDETYAKLLARLTTEPNIRIPSGLKEDILAFYSDPTAPIATKRNPAKWAAVQSELVTLQSLPTIPEP